jgi:hypothetical protein
MFIQFYSEVPRNELHRLAETRVLRKAVATEFGIDLVKLPPEK